MVDQASKPTVLIIDDNEQNRYTLSRYLRRAGFEILEADSASGGFEKAQSKPLLVILDVQLPDQLGFDVCKKLKSNPKTCSIPILLTSASFVKAGDRIYGLDEGADAYLAGPVDPDELVATVRALLRIRRAENVAQQLAEQWQQTFDAISDGVCLINSTGEIDRCNQAFAKILQKTPQEILGTDFHEVVEKTPLEELKFWKVSDLQARESREFFYGDRCFKLTADPVIKNNLRDGFVFIISEITGLKQTEESRNLAFEIAQLGEWDLDLETDQVVRSPRHDQIFGYTIRQSQWNWETTINHIHPLDREAFTQAFYQSLDAGKLMIETRILWPDKSTHWICFRAAAHYNKEQKPIRLIGVVSDITFFKSAEEELKALNERLSNYTVELEHKVSERTAKLEETVRSLESFCYSIAHDLKSPLRAIIGFTQILREDYAPQFDDTGRDFTDRMIYAAKRMNRLIEDLLSYGRLTHMDLPCTTLNLESQVESLLIKFREDLAEKSADISVKRPMPNVCANSAVLDQVLSNLLGNALKFVKPGEVPHVNIYAQERRNTVRLWIRDNGIGIDPVHHDRIFQVFERLHTDRTYPGTGIGLAIVRKGIERMGGRVGLESTPGGGSSFWIELRKSNDDHPAH